MPTNYTKILVKMVLSILNFKWFYDKLILYTWVYAPFLNWAKNYIKNGPKKLTVSTNFISRIGEF